MWSLLHCCFFVLALIITISDSVPLAAQDLERRHDASVVRAPPTQEPVSMSASDIGTISGVAVAIIGILASLWAVFWQVRKGWLLHSANLVTTLVDRFNSPDWEAKRVRCINLLLKSNNDSERTLVGNYGFGVFGFFENIAYLVHCGALHPMMVFNKFAWEIVCYHQLAHGEIDLIAQIRKRGSNTEYMEFDWLCDKMLKIYHEFGTEIYDSSGRVKWMGDFITQETMLS